MNRIRFLAGASHYSLNKKIAMAFKRGKSMEELKKYYGLSLEEIEERIRMITKVPKV